MLSSTCYRCGRIVFESGSHFANGTRWHRRCWDEAVAEARATVEAMPAEPRPVVPGTEGLRERLLGAIANEMVTGGGYRQAGRIVNLVMQEITAAGLSLVAAGYEVHPSTLPVICEEHEESDWNGSTIERRYYQTCPYCGDRYGLGMHPPPDHSLLRPRPGDLEPLAGGDR